MIYKPTNFTGNTRNSETVSVKQSVTVNGKNINVVYSSIGKEFKNIVNNNITTATNIISGITTTSGTFFAGNTLGRIREDVGYGS